MIKRIGDTIYEERRRLLFVCSLAFIAGVLLYGRVGVPVGGVPLYIITGAAYAFLIGIATIAVCLWAPRFRFMLDGVAVSRLILALFAYAYPAFGLTLLMSPLLQAVIVVGGGVLVSRMLHGRVCKQPRAVPIPVEGAVAPPARRRRRGPARISAPTPFQRSFVRWVDDQEPIAV